MSGVLIYSPNIFLTKALELLCYKANSSGNLRVSTCHSCKDLFTEVKGADYLIYDDADALWSTIRRFLIIRKINPTLRLLSIKNGLECDYENIFRSAMSDNNCFKKMSVECIQQRLMHLLWRDRSACHRLTYTSYSLNLDWLTARENKILKLILKGYRNKEISACLSLHEKSVSMHRTKIYKKINVRSIAGLWKLLMESK